MRRSIWRQLTSALLVALAGALCTPLAGAQPSGDWLTYQHDPTRSGVAGGGFNPANAAMHWESEPLDGQVYAQPLIAANQVFCRD